MELEAHAARVDQLRARVEAWEASATSAFREDPPALRRLLTGKIAPSDMHAAPIPSSDAAGPGASPKAADGESAAALGTSTARASARTRSGASNRLQKALVAATQYGFGAAKAAMVAEERSLCVRGAALLLQLLGWIAGEAISTPTPLVLGLAPGQQPSEGALRYVLQVLPTVDMASSSSSPKYKPDAALSPRATLADLRAENDRRILHAVGLRLNLSPFPPVADSDAGPAEAAEAAACAERLSRALDAPMQELLAELRWHCAVDRRLMEVTTGFERLGAQCRTARARRAVASLAGADRQLLLGSANATVLRIRSAVVEALAGYGCFARLTADGFGPRLRALFAGWHSDRPAGADVAPALPYATVPMRIAALEMVVPRIAGTGDPAPSPRGGASKSAVMDPVARTLNNALAQLTSVLPTECHRWLFAPDLLASPLLLPLVADPAVYWAGAGSAAALAARVRAKGLALTGPNGVAARIADYITGFGAGRPQSAARSERSGLARLSGRSTPDRSLLSDSSTAAGGLESEALGFLVQGVNARAVRYALDTWTAIHDPAQPSRTGHPPRGGGEPSMSAASPSATQRALDFNAPLGTAAGHGTSVLRMVADDPEGDAADSDAASRGTSPTAASKVKAASSGVVDPTAAAAARIQRRFRAYVAERDACLQCWRLMCAADPTLEARARHELLAGKTAGASTMGALRHDGPGGAPHLPPSLPPLFPSPARAGGTTLTTSTKPPTAPAPVSHITLISQGLPKLSLFGGSSLNLGGGPGSAVGSVLGSDESAALDWQPDSACTFDSTIRSVRPVGTGDAWTGRLETIMAQHTQDTHLRQFNMPSLALADSTTGVPPLVPQLTTQPESTPTPTEIALPPAPARGGARSGSLARLNDAAAACEVPPLVPTASLGAGPPNSEETANLHPSSAHRGSTGPVFALSIESQDDAAAMPPPIATRGGRRETDDAAAGGGPSRGAAGRSSTRSGGGRQRADPEAEARQVSAACISRGWRAFRERRRRLVDAAWRAGEEAASPVDAVEPLPEGQRVVAADLDAAESAAAASAPKDTVEQGAHASVVSDPIPVETPTLEEEGAPVAATNDVPATMRRDVAVPPIRWNAPLPPLPDLDDLIAQAEAGILPEPLNNDSDQAVADAVATTLADDIDAREDLDPISRGILKRTLTSRGGVNESQALIEAARLLNAVAVARGDGVDLDAHRNSRSRRASEAPSAAADMAQAIAASDEALRLPYEVEDWFLQQIEAHKIHEVFFLSARCGPPILLCGVANACSTETLGASNVAAVAVMHSQAAKTAVWATTHAGSGAADAAGDALCDALGPSNAATIQTLRDVCAAEPDEADELDVSSPTTSSGASTQHAAAGSTDSLLTLRFASTVVRRPCQMWGNASLILRCAARMGLDDLIARLRVSDLSAWYDATPALALDHTLRGLCHLAGVDSLPAAKAKLAADIGFLVADDSVPVVAVLRGVLGVESRRLIVPWILVRGLARLLLQLDGARLHDLALCVVSAQQQQQPDGGVASSSMTSGQFSAPPPPPAAAGGLASLTDLAAAVRAARRAPRTAWGSPAAVAVRDSPALDALRQTIFAPGTLTSMWLDGVACHDETLSAAAASQEEEDTGDADGVGRTRPASSPPVLPDEAYAVQVIIASILGPALLRLHWWYDYNFRAPYQPADAAGGDEAYDGAEEETGATPDPYGLADADGAAFRLGDDSENDASAGAVLTAWMRHGEAGNHHGEDGEEMGEGDDDVYHHLLARPETRLGDISDIGEDEEAAY